MISAEDIAGSYKRIVNKKLFFVKELPASEEQDISMLKKLSKAEFEKLRKDSNKAKLKKTKAA
jgi:hypothetical protein